MLDDHAGGAAFCIELGQAFVRRVGVVEVVVGEPLALHLAGGRDPETVLRRAIECSGLMRVLAVAQGLNQPSRERAPGRRRIGEFFGEPGGDRCVIGGGAGERLGGKSRAQVQTGCAGVRR